MRVSRRNLYEAAQHEAVAAQLSSRAPGQPALRPHRLVASRRPKRGEPPARGTSRSCFRASCWWRWPASASFAPGGATRGPLALSMAAVGGPASRSLSGPTASEARTPGCTRDVFGFQAIRAPARFGVLVAFGLAVLAAVGVRDLFGIDPLAPVRGAPRLSHRRAGARVRQRAAARRFPPRRPLARRAMAACGTGSGGGALPAARRRLGQHAGDARFADARPAPIVNGYSGQRPSFFMGLVDTLSGLPSGRGTLDAARPRRPVRRQPRAPLGMADVGWPVAARRARALRRGDRLRGRVVARDRGSAATARTAAADLPPGTVPFDQQERADYRVIWLTGAALGVPAGQAVITAERLTGGTAGSIRVAGSRWKAPTWVTRFFEAHDRFETATDAQAAPDGDRSSTCAKATGAWTRRLASTRNGAPSRVADGPTLPLPPRRARRPGGLPLRQDAAARPRGTRRVSRSWRAAGS